MLRTGLAQEFLFGNLNYYARTNHLSDQLMVFTSVIAKDSGVDQEFLKSDTKDIRGGVLFGLRVLDGMIRNNPSNLIRVIPTKGARRQRRFSLGLSRSLFSESFPDCNLK